MSLREAIELALRNNRSVQIAELDQTISKYENWVAQREFYPRLNLEGSAYARSSEPAGSGGNASRMTSATIEPVVVNKIPTGGEFRFAWEQTAEREHAGDGDDWTPSRMSASFRQPLLRGGGLTAGTAARVKARRAYQDSLLSMRSTLIGTVTRVITAYRALLKSRRQADIAALQLERARQNVAINQALIEAGRMAAGDLVQAEADVATQELSLHYALNRLDADRLALLDLLEVDLRMRIVPTETLEIQAVNVTLEECLETALELRSDYLSTLLKAENTELEWALAKNNQLWNLSLTLDYQRDDDSAGGMTSNGRDEWRGALTLDIPLYGDWSRKQTLFNAEVHRKQSALEIAELRDQIEAQIINALRDVDSLWRETQLAARARELTQRKMEMEEENLRLGRSSNFALISYRHDLAQAEINELNARIGYLNALTSLDQLLGSTLETWKIEWNENESVVQFNE